MEEHRLNLKLSAEDAAILKESKLPKEIPILAPDRADYTKDLWAITDAARKVISEESLGLGDGVGSIFKERRVDRVRAAVLKVTRNDCPSLDEYAESSENVVRKDLAQARKHRRDREAKLAAEEKRRAEYERRMEEEKLRKESAEAEAAAKEKKRELEFAATLAASGSTHVLVGVDGNGRACDEQLDGSFICQTLYICDVATYKDSVAKGISWMKLLSVCNGGPAAVNCVLTLPDADPLRKKIRYFNLEARIGLVRGPNTELQNGFGAKVPAASWFGRGTSVFIPLPVGRAH
jgi:hypothetical protein